MGPQEWYNNNLSETKQNLNKVNKTILYISIIRILLFVGCISTVIALWSYSMQTIIIDEILKGTNSTDKQKGSFSLIRQFMTLKANGIIATHDLLLGELVNYFPNQIRNYCFEADIKNNELYFSYKIREGIAQNMNACFLMKKMGIVIEDN